MENVIDNAYINQLWDALTHTCFVEDDATSVEDYSSGVESAYQIFTMIRRAGGKVFFIGNGGSAAIASHMTADYMKNGYMNTCSLFNEAVVTCMGNDYGYEYIFEKQIDLLARQDDLLVAISSSGNSANIIKAVEKAKAKGCKVITLTGFLPDNQVKQMGDLNIYVPIEKYGVVESVHNLILQHIVDMIYERLGDG